MTIEAEGTKLAKVLWYYNLVPNVSTLVQKIVCPFHADVNPSLTVKLEEGSWFCFGCNEFGDAAKFVRLMEHKYNGLNDLQAYKKYLKILKSNECSGIKVDASQKQYKRSSRQLYNEAYDYYHGLKLEDWRAPESLEAQVAKEYMVSRGFTSTSLNKCKAKVNYSASYGIIFPMVDNGKFKGWVCRTMLPEVEKRRKYLYNKGFSRATTLVGDYGSEDYVIVVEGYMDRLKFLQNGVDNVVAILGWKMTAQQIEKLKAKGVTKVISALDNDPCGKKGTEHLKNFFEVTRFCYLKGVKDPGEMDKGLFHKMFRKTMRVHLSGAKKGTKNGPSGQDQTGRKEVRSKQR